MELLKERIRKDGVVKEGNVLKVDRFLNHQMDVNYSVRSVKNLRNVLKAKISIRSLRSKHQESESHVLWQRFLMYQSYLRRKPRQRTSREMYIQQR